MADDDPIPADDDISDALLDAADEAYERLTADGGNDPGGVAWDVMSDEAIVSEFTARDWRYLYALGAWRLRNTPYLPPEQRAVVDNDLAFTLPHIALMTLMGDRYDEQHPEVLAEIRAETAAELAEAERLEALAAALNAPWSDALLDTLNVVVSQWRVGQPDAFGAIDDPELGGRLTDDDWAKLVALGEDEAEADPHRGHLIATNFADDPERGKAGLGLLQLARQQLDAVDIDHAPPPPPSRGLLDGFTTRLWRRKQIVPGVRVNLSKSGPSLTLGVRGGHVTYGPRGKTETIGIPGTGAYLQRRTPKDDT